MIDGLLETDAVIEPATSGGPLMGADGRVVGITSRLGDDTSYAVPANVARGVLAELEERHKVIRPWLGVRGRERAGRRRGDRRRTPAARPTSPGSGPATSCESIDGVEVRHPRRACSTRSTGARSATPSSCTCCARAPRARSTVRLEERPATVPAG